MITPPDQHPALLAAQQAKSTLANMYGSSDLSTEQGLERAKFLSKFKSKLLHAEHSNHSQEEVQASEESSIQAKAIAMMTVAERQRLAQ